MNRKDQRDVVSPETELRDGQQARDEDADLDRAEAVRIAELAGEPPEKQRHENQRGNLENAQQRPPADNDYGQDREDEAPDESADFLPARDARHGLIAGIASGLA